MQSVNNLKKIAIITYTRAYNYGSALQAYALNRYLNDLGFKTLTIDYTTPDQKNLYRIFEPHKGLMSMLRNLHSLLLYRKLKKHLNKFDQFIESNIPLTTKITSENTIDLLNDNFDYFICGSDQIWNAECADYNSNYMLSFVSDKKKCIAYAPSLGAGGSNEKTIIALKNFTLNFKALSSREATGAKIISSVTKRKVTTVVDPVLLLTKEEWDKITNDNFVKNLGDYILGYFIGDIPSMREFARNMSMATNRKVIVIYKSLRDLNYGFKEMYDCGPTDFISLIKHSKGIVTNSFHAITFSLILQKDFWAFIGEGSSDTRILDLLNMVNLKNRIVNLQKTNNYDYRKKIPYSDIDLSSLQSQIQLSKNYLINNIS